MSYLYPERRLHVHQHQELKDQLGLIGREFEVGDELPLLQAI